MLTRATQARQGGFISKALSNTKFIQGAVPKQLKTTIHKNSSTETEKKTEILYDCAALQMFAEHELSPKLDMFKLSNI